MATIKSYTDIEQSRRLSKILEVDTADCYYPVTYIEESTNKYLMCYIKPYIGRLSEVEGSVDTRLYIPCWSLAALLNVFEDKGFYYKLYFDGVSNVLEVTNIDNHNIHEMNYNDYSIDVCYEIILKLNELNLL